jgi:hypothetical protein
MPAKLCLPYCRYADCIIQFYLLSKIVHSIIDKIMRKIAYIQNGNLM